jgi:hypothetical protein
MPTRSPASITSNPVPKLAPKTPLAREAVRQLRAWLANPAFEFGLPLAPAGTHFQRRVWAADRDHPARTNAELRRSRRCDPQRPARGGQCLWRQSLSDRRALPSRRRGESRHRAALRGIPAASCSTSSAGCCATSMQASDASLIDEFIDALWLADGLSKNTLASYRSDLALFSDWLAEKETTR